MSTRKRFSNQLKRLTNGGTTFRSDAGTTNPEPLSANQVVQHHNRQRQTARQTALDM